LAGSAPARAGSGALGLASVAAGRRDGYVENHIRAWDCLAGVALVREAGGYVSDFLAGGPARATIDTARRRPLGEPLFPAARACQGRRFVPPRSG
jgi:fructose-1,6-bisphosphatase/inositol monophosphatase family enzyme